MSTGKRKHDEIASTYYIPQRDGAADIELCTSAIDMSSDLVSEFPLDISCRGRQFFFVVACLVPINVKCLLYWCLL